MPPRVTEQEALEHAAQMADRFRRQYLSAIRGLRDYRRYGPVIVQNAGQVNIAADGGQQVNVKGKRRKKATGKGKQAKPKQLGAKKESIRMQPTSEVIQFE